MSNKQRDVRSSGWFVTINTNQTYEKLGGEDGVNKFKRAIVSLFNTYEGLAQLLTFNVPSGMIAVERTMDKIEAIKKFVVLPIYTEGCIERQGKRGETSFIHAHILVGIYHYSWIHLSSSGAIKFLSEKMGLKGLMFKIGNNQELKVYKEFPTRSEALSSILYAGKYLKTHGKDGDYIVGDKLLNYSDFVEKYQKDLPSSSSNDSFYQSKESPTLSSAEVRFIPPS
jgi:hypothetical protein